MKRSRFLALVLEAANRFGCNSGGSPEERANQALKDAGLHSKSEEAMTALRALLFEHNSNKVLYLLFLIEESYELFCKSKKKAA